MRDFYRIGCAVGLAFVFGGAAAHAQGGGGGANASAAGAAASAPAAGAAAGVPAGGNAAGGFSPAPGDADESTQPAAKKVTPQPKARMSAFNRVTTTRKVVVPAPSPRSGAAKAGAANAGATKDPGVPASSSFRQAPERPTRPPATATRSVTHSYYPTLRGGQYKNANTARVANGGKTRMPVQAGVGMSAAGARSAPGSRGAEVTAPGRGGVPSASGPRR